MSGVVHTHLVQQGGSETVELVPPDELASYCVHALAGAGTQRSKTAVRRLVTVTLAGLRPQR